MTEIEPVPAVFITCELTRHSLGQNEACVREGFINFNFSLLFPPNIFLGVPYITMVETLSSSAAAFSAFLATSYFSLLFCLVLLLFYLTKSSSKWRSDVF